jgi:histidinol-phosphate aminotransferase
VIIKPKKSVESLQAYNPGLFRAKYKMDANESPYDLPAAYKNRIMNKIRKIQFNRYPDSAAAALKKAVARRNRVKPGNIFFGNGSDEIINYLLQAFCAPGETVIIPVPTFEMYGIAGVINCNKVIEVPLDGNLDLDDAGIIRMAKKTGAKFIFLAYPNNPTGNCFSAGRILNILKATGSFVVVDEAYLEFSGKTFSGYLKKFRNLIILRTFSKLYSAAIRLGYMIADKNVISAAEKVRLPYNINSFTQVIALEILKLGKYTARIAAGIRKERERVYAALKKKYTVQKSDSNFLFIKMLRGARASGKYFKKNGFSIRIWKSGHAAGWMRLTIGTPAENSAALKLLIGGDR